MGKPAKFDFTAKEVAEMLLFKLIQDDTLPQGNYVFSLTAERARNDPDLKITLSAERESK